MMMDMKSFENSFSHVKVGPLSMALHLSLAISPLVLLEGRKLATITVNQMKLLEVRPFILA